MYLRFDREEVRLSVNSGLLSLLELLLFSGVVSSCCLAPYAVDQPSSAACPHRNAGIRLAFARSSSRGPRGSSQDLLRVLAQRGNGVTEGVRLDPSSSHVDADLLLLAFHDLHLLHRRGEGLRPPGLPEPRAVDVTEHQAVRSARAGSRLSQRSRRATAVTSGRETTRL